MRNNRRYTKKSSRILSNLILNGLILKSLGAEITEGNGSRVRIKLGNERAVFHRPHPERVTDKGAVKSVRRFLDNAGVKK